MSMLRNGFKTGYRLGNNPDSTVESIQISKKNRKYGLGYDFIKEDESMKGTKKKSDKFCLSHYLTCTSPSK